MDLMPASRVVLGERRETREEGKHNSQNFFSAYQLALSPDISSRPCRNFFSALARWELFSGQSLAMRSAVGTYTVRNVFEVTHLPINFRQVLLLTTL